MLEDKKKNKFFNFILTLIIFFCLNALNLFNPDILSSSGVFKINDILIAILITNSITRRKKSVAPTSISKIVKFMIYFLLFYFIYTILLVNSATPVEALKISRYYFYLIVFFIIIRNLDIASIMYFWIFLRLINVFTVAAFIIIFLTQNSLLIGISWEFAPIPRIYHYLYTIAMLIFLFGFVQFVMAYKGKFKINSYEVICALFTILVSLSRGLWIATLLGVIIILLLFTFNIIKSDSYTKKIRNISIFVIVIILASILIIDKYGDIFSERVIFAQQDVATGGGTYSYRTYFFDLWFSVNEKLGLEFTGLGFPHTQSKLIQSAANIPAAQESWGTESSIYMNIIQFGYLGFIIWSVCFFLLSFYLIFQNRNIKLNFSAIFGISLSVYIFVSYFIAGFSGQAIIFLLLGFLLAMYDNSRRHYNDLESKELKNLSDL